MSQSGQLLQRQPERGQVTSIAGPGAYPPNRPLHVPHPGQLRSKTLQASGIVHENLHHVLTPFDGLDGCQRLGQPIAQPPRAHGRHGAIERAEQASIARRVLVQRLQDLQVAQRREIKSQKIGSFIERQPREVGRLPAQVLCQVVQHRAGGADGRRPFFQAEPIQRSHFEMLAHREQSRFGRKYPIIISIQNPPESGGIRMIGRTVPLFSIERRGS